MERRHEQYNITVDYVKKQEAAGDVLVIQPEEALPIKRVEHDADNMRYVYNIGRSIAMGKMKRIKEFLSCVR